MPTFSVVIPVYNVEDYLALSMASLRAQTFGDFEAICVEDGSTDASPEMLDRLAAIDTRFKVFHRENRGVSSARNFAMAQATGDYIWFLDADDLLVEDALQTVADTIHETDADVVVFGGMPYPEFRGYPWLNWVLSPNDHFYDGFQTDLLFKECTRPYTWRTVARRSLIEKWKVRYIENLACGEDQAFQFMLYPRSSKTAVLSAKLVKYRLNRKDSAMAQRIADKRKLLEDNVNLVEYILRDWKQAGLLARYPEDMFQWTVEFIVVDIMTSEEPDRTRFCERLREIWHRYFKNELIEKQSIDKVNGFLVRAVLDEGAGTFMNSPSVMRFRYFLAKDGYVSTLKRTYRSVRHMVGSRVKKKPVEQGESGCAMLTEEERWEREDAAARAQATADLKAGTGLFAPASSVDQPATRFEVQGDDR